MSPLAAARIGTLVAAFGLSVMGAPSLGAPVQYPFSLTLYDQPDYRGGSVTFYGDNANIGSTGFATRARSAQIRGTWRLCEGGGYRNRCEILSSNVRDLDAVGFSGRVGSAQRLSGATAPPPEPEPQPQREPQTQPQPPRTIPPPPYAQTYPAPYSSQPSYPTQSPYPTPSYEPAARYGYPGYAAPDAPPPANDAPPGPGRFDRADRRPADQPPPAVDAPLPAPGRFGRADRRPPAAPLPPAPQPPPVADRYGEAPVLGSTSVFFPTPAIAGADVAAWTSRDAADGFCRLQGLGEALYADQGQRAPRAVDLGGRPVGEGPVLRDVLCRR